MKISCEHIRAIQSLGYTEDEARFLYIVANHSGYFVPRQFIAFTGASWGKRSQQFTDKLESRGHVTWREYQDMGGVYHLFSKTLYRQIDRENLRNRRRHSTEFIRTRLLLLDFVLANQVYDYLETEDDKVRFFCDELAIPKKALPAKAYEGVSTPEPTLRYFVDKFPLFLATTNGSSSPVVTFSYVDPGQASLTGFANHLNAYASLFRHLQQLPLRLHSAFYGPFHPRRAVLLLARENPVASRCLRRTGALLPVARRVGRKAVRNVIERRYRMARPSEQAFRWSAHRAALCGLVFE